MSLLRKKPPPTRKRPLNETNSHSIPATSVPTEPTSLLPAPNVSQNSPHTHEIHPTASAEVSLWAHKHSPLNSAGLAVHRKKVEEIRTFLSSADAALQLSMPPTPRMLLISGPPGCGKSTALRVLASELGFEVCEWVEGRSVRWTASEPGSAPYESRLAQFGHFLASSLRTLSLAVSGGGTSRDRPAPALRRRLVLLEELPISANSGERADTLMQQQQVHAFAPSQASPLYAHTGVPLPPHVLSGCVSTPVAARGTAPPVTAVNRSRNHLNPRSLLPNVQAMLRRALETARFPLVLILCSDSSGGGVPRQIDTLLGAATAAHPALVRHIACNPIADSLLTKAVRSVAAAEQLQISPEAIAQIVSSANGDLRHAINKLQIRAAGATVRSAKGLKAGGPNQGRGRGGKAAGAKSGAGGVKALGSAAGASDMQERDRFRDIFHTIGKLLHAPAKRAKVLRERGGELGRAGASERAAHADAGDGNHDGDAAHRWWDEPMTGRLAAVPTGQKTMVHDACGGAAAASCDTCAPGTAAPSVFASVPTSLDDEQLHAWSMQPTGWPVGLIAHDWASLAAAYASRAVSRGIPADPVPRILPPPFATLSAVLDGIEPETLLDSSALDEASTLAFLQQNYLVHFGDISDVARAADGLSSAAVLVGEARSRPWISTAVLPLAGSIACRAVTSLNQHPEPSRFSQCTKPASFGAEKTARERADTLAFAFAPRGSADAPGASASNPSTKELLSPAGMLGGAQLACELVPYLPRLLHVTPPDRGMWTAGALGGVETTTGQPGYGHTAPGGAQSVGLTPTQREVVIALTSLGGRDLGSTMAPAVALLPTDAAIAGGKLGRQQQVLLDDIEE